MQCNVIWNRANGSYDDKGGRGRSDLLHFRLLESIYAGQSSVWMVIQVLLSHRQKCYVAIVYIMVVISTHYMFWHVALGRKKKKTVYQRYW